VRLDLSPQLINRKRRQASQRAAPARALHRNATAVAASAASGATPAGCRSMHPLPSE
jgi:hypothetical protein